MITRLNYCNENTKVKVAEINGGRGVFESAKEFGIFPGTELELTKRLNGKGPINVKIDNRLLSLGREFASKLLVETEEDIVIGLDQTKRDDVVEVEQMLANGDIRFRLLDMGLVKGVKLKIIRFAPLGDPIEVMMNGFNLSLRLEEAKNIKVKVKSFGKTRNGFGKGKLFGWRGFGR